MTLSELITLSSQIDTQIEDINALGVTNLSLYAISTPLNTSDIITNISSIYRGG